MYASVTLHGIAAGTDTTQAWARAIYLLTGAGILALIFYRVQHRLPQTGWVRTARIAAALTAALVAGLLVTRAGLFSGASNSTANSSSLRAASASVVALAKRRHRSACSRSICDLFGSSAICAETSARKSMIHAMTAW